MLIIWKGRGILIPFSAMGGLMVGIFAGSATVAIWGAAAGVWVFALTLGKTQVQRQIDPGSGQPITVRRAHSLYFIPPIPWAVLTTVLAILATFLMTFPPTSDRGNRSPFRTADAMVLTNQNGVANGNTPAAAKLAQTFSASVKAMRDLAIEKGKKGVSLSGGEFLTYAHVTPSRCVFLVHVPQLRNFTPDAKEAMAEIAWGTAQQVAANLEPKPKTLAVGIRGALLYERALIGRLAETVEAWPGAVERKIEGTDAIQALTPFFEPATEDLPAMPAPPAPTAAKAEATTPAPPPVSAPSPTSPTPSSVPSAPVAKSPAVRSSPDLAKLPTGVRDWKAADGRTMRASLVRFTGADRTTAEFRREDGQLFQVPLARFSEADQAFMRALPAE